MVVCSRGVVLLARFQVLLVGELLSVGAQVEAVEVMTLPKARVDAAVHAFLRHAIQLVALQVAVLRRVVLGAVCTLARRVAVGCRWVLGVVAVAVLRAAKHGRDIPIRVVGRGRGREGAEDGR